MTPSVVVSTLAKAFGALTATQLERLEWHREKKTRVLCGNECREMAAFEAG